MPTSIPRYGKKQLKNPGTVFLIRSLHYLKRLINSRLKYTEVKFRIDTEYAPEYLKEVASQYAEIWQLNKTTFGPGRRHRKFQQQRQYEKLIECIAKLESI